MSCPLLLAARVLFPLCTISGTAPPGLALLADFEHSAMCFLVVTCGHRGRWPEDTECGFEPSSIVPYLRRGMMRPGVPELLSYLRVIGATIVVYTHSEERWATKVCEALEHCAGWPFITKLYSRMDCRDGNPEFSARKSLDYICRDLQDDGFDWVDIQNTVMFDDEATAVSGEELDRLVVVPSYDHWAPCAWDENVTEELLAKNPKHLADVVRATVVAWGVAPPSYVNMRPGIAFEPTSADLRYIRHGHLLACRMQRRPGNITALAPCSCPGVQQMFLFLGCSKYSQARCRIYHSCSHYPSSLGASFFFCRVPALASGVGFGLTSALVTSPGGRPR